MTNEMEMGADTGALMWGLLAVNVLTCGYIVTLAWARRTRVGILLPCGRVPWRQAAAWIFFGVAGTLAVSISYVWALRAFNIQMPMQDVLGILLRVASAGETVVVIVTGMVLIPVCEEIMFRGVIFSALRRRMTLWAAVTLSAIIFAVVHLQVIYLLPIGLMGAVSALSYVRTKSLVVPIGMHVLNNLVALGYLFWRLWTLG